MRMHLPLPVLAICMMVTPPPITAQPKLPGQWSIMGYLALNRGMSPGMRGTLAAFSRQYDSDYTTPKYPFADDRATCVGTGGHLAYRFPESNFSAFVGMSGEFFLVDDGLWTQSYGMGLFLFTWTMGSEYTLGLPSERWNAFGRVGLTASWITGKIDYQYYFSSEILTATRFGFSTEIGGRYNMPFAPLAVELAVGYSDANLIGSAYKTPMYLEGSNVMKERDLNDAANPADAGDHGRTIDFLSLRLGGRIWF